MNEYQMEVMKGFVGIEALDSDQFLKLKETLTRIGIPAKSGSDEELPTLWQSVHVFHNRGRYYLVHFKQMFLLDGRVKSTVMTDDDFDRLESIAALLEKWGLARCLEEMPPQKVKVRVIPYHEKDAWNLRAKYKIGQNLSKGKTNA